MNGKDGCDHPGIWSCILGCARIQDPGHYPSNHLRPSEQVRLATWKRAACVGKLRERYQEIISWEELRKHLNKVTKPARYTGGELNSVRKDPSSVSVRFALVFPDVYEVGMSHLGSQIIYHVLNSRDDTACERAYSPWPDMEELSRRRGWPLFTLESRSPLNSFDIVGFSLAYELTYSNVLAALDLGGIPLFSAERTGEDPLVIAGGPVSMAAEPLAEFIDAFALGDGEELAGDIVDCYKKWRASGKPRPELLESLADIEGVYVPSLYDVRYSDGFVVEVRPKAGAPERVRRRIFNDLEKAPYPERPVVPFLEPVHDRAMVEIFRGCTRGCRFCQAGTLYRPVRERKPETVSRVARKILAASGYDEVSLVSLSSADYSPIRQVIEDIVAHSPCPARVSLPSLRVDSFSVELSKLLGEAGHGGLTLAPEAGSQRMRDVINKNVTEEDIMDAAKAAFSSGFTRIKLYFMIGLPGETDEDVLAIADLAYRIRQLGRDMGVKPTIAVSVSGFVPKPHTAFQWEPFVGRDEIERRQSLLYKRLRGPGLELRYHDSRQTYLEAILSRGDRRLGRVVFEAYRRGARFDSWPDMLDLDLWLTCMKESSLEPDFFTRERGEDEILPWDHLDPGVTKEFLLAERAKARRAEKTPDCREAPCHGCGVCPRFGVAPVLTGKDSASKGARDPAR
ncbi:MAG: TIGR03960 family B12-binding radical SAM protein [Firmicutes bacterium]|nr:TIGR03960 family B12-binding radical SAM protein [Candidatus Fermentithermobacillaceae bacterium]